MMSDLFKIRLPKIASPTMRALNNLGIHHLEDLQRFTIEELLDEHGFGPSSVPVLNKAMEDAGLRYRSKK